MAMNDPDERVAPPAPVETYSEAVEVLLWETSQGRLSWEPLEDDGYRIGDYEPEESFETKASGEKVRLYGMAIPRSPIQRGFEIGRGLWRPERIVAIRVLDQEGGRFEWVPLPPPSYRTDLQPALRDLLRAVRRQPTRASALAKRIIAGGQRAA